MTYTKWTSEQDGILQKNYAENGLKNCALLLNLPEKKTKARAEYLGLKRERNLILVPTGFKWCAKCKTSKTIKNFAKDRNRRRADCKSCNSEKSIDYYQKNKSKSIRRINQWNKENPSKRILYRQSYYQRNKIKIKLYNQRPEIKIKMNLRNRLGHICRGKKCDTTEKLVGCYWIDLRVYLEAKFLPGMTWENYGTWHIDHIRPCSSFDLTDPAQQRECFHYTNLQPLWAIDNLIKSNSIN